MSEAVRAAAVQERAVGLPGSQGKGGLHLLGCSSWTYSLPSLPVAICSKTTLNTMSPCS